MENYADTWKKFWISNESFYCNEFKPAVRVADCAFDALVFAVRLEGMKLHVKCTYSRDNNKFLFLKYTLPEVFCTDCCSGTDCETNAEYLLLLFCCGGTICTVDVLGLPLILLLFNCVGLISFPAWVLCCLRRPGATYFPTLISSGLLDRGRSTAANFASSFSSPFSTSVLSLYAGWLSISRAIFSACSLASLWI